MEQTGLWLKDVMKVDWLRENGSAQYFGLGFIQWKGAGVHAERRLHYYHPSILPITGEDELHDHRYAFDSSVLKGAIGNYLYEAVPFSSIPDMSPESEYGKFAVSCSREDAGKEPTLIEAGLFAEFIGYFYTSFGAGYMLMADTFHKVSVIQPTITSIHRYRTIKDVAHVLRPINAPHVCPFSKTLGQDEIWDIIKATIDD